MIDLPLLNRGSAWRRAYLQEKDRVFCESAYFRALCHIAKLNQLSIRFGQDCPTSSLVKQAVQSQVKIELNNRKSKRKENKK